MSIATKLQLKPGQRVAIVDSPGDMSLALPDAESHGDPSTADAVVQFVRRMADVEERAEPAIAAARRDALAWVAYPKAGQLGTDLNRDTLAAALIARGVRPVRQIAIDEVWSALRLRPAS